MNAEIIIVGEEILGGHTIDSNSAYIARRLAEIGVEVVYKTTIGDRHDDIVDAIKQGLERSAVTIMTGGLGPTKDDVTKNAICTAFERQLVLNDEVLRKLEALYQRRNLKMPAIVQSQALQPLGADLINNPIGTAPGIVFQDAERFFVALPGVPSEMEAIIDQSVIPFLARRPGRPAIVIRRIRTTGITESEIAETIAELEPDGGKLRLAYLPSYRGVDLRVTALAMNAEESATAAEQLAKAIISKLGDYVFAVGDASLPEIVGELLKAKKQTLATAESCTGGMIAKLLTDSPGSSEFYRGSVVAYANDVKESVLRISKELLDSHGAVSAEVAEAMARGARDVIGVDHALAITGVAGPGGGTSEKPVGLVYIGYADAGHSEHLRLNLFGTRERIRERSAYQALDFLRRKLAAK